MSESPLQCCIYITHFVNEDKNVKKKIAKGRFGVFSITPVLSIALHFRLVIGILPILLLEATGTKSQRALFLYWQSVVMTLTLYVIGWGPGNAILLPHLDI